MKNDIADTTRRRSLTAITVARRALIAVVLAALAPPALAGFRDTFIDPQDHSFDVSKYLSENRFGFLPVPILITQPAVGEGLGMAGIFFHESREQRQERLSQSAASGHAILPANVSILGGAATNNGTWGAAVGQLGFWKNDTIRYQGFLGYPSLNLDFYSLGGVELPRPVELNVEGPSLFNQLRFRLGSGDLFLGARQLYRRVDTTLVNDSQASRLLPSGTYPEVDALLDEHLNHTTSISGVGGIIEYDTTSNPFNPERGYNWSAWYMWFDDAIGSDIDYTAYTAKALNYWTIREKWVLGLRIEYDGVSNHDDVRLPPYIPPAINLRGVSATRYQGNDVLESEVELDYKINFRWKIGAFAGVGRAAQSFSDLQDASSVVSKGVGFRYLIARRYGFVVGIDVAKGPEEWAYYVQAGATWR